eukprot:14446-Heterococcus_DN1.PRE.2
MAIRRYNVNSTRPTYACGALQALFGALRPHCTSSLSIVNPSGCSRRKPATAAQHYLTPVNLLFTGACLRTSANAALPIAHLLAQLPLPLLVSIFSRCGRSIKWASGALKLLPTRQQLQCTLAYDVTYALEEVYTATHSTSDYGEKVEVGLCCSVDSSSNCSSNPPDALLPRSSGLGTAVLSHEGTHCSSVVATRDMCVLHRRYKRLWFFDASLWCTIGESRSVQQLVRASASSCFATGSRAHTTSSSCDEQFCALQCL